MSDPYDDADRKTMSGLYDEIELLKAAIVERDSIIARLEAGQSATASLDRWNAEYLDGLRRQGHE